MQNLPQNTFPTTARRSRRLSAAWLVGAIAAAALLLPVTAPATTAWATSGTAAPDNLSEFLATSYGFTDPIDAIRREYSSQNPGRIQFLSGGDVYDWNGSSLTNLTASFAGVVSDFDAESFGTAFFVSAGRAYFVYGGGANINDLSATLATQGFTGAIDSFQLDFSSTNSGRIQFLSEGNIYQ